MAVDAATVEPAKTALLTARRRGSAPEITVTFFERLRSNQQTDELPLLGSIIFSLSENDVPPGVSIIIDIFRL